MNIRYLVFTLIMLTSFSAASLNAIALGTNSQQSLGLSFGPTFGYTFLATQNFKITALGYIPPPGSTGFVTQTVDFWSSTKAAWGSSNPGINTKLASAVVVYNGPTSFSSAGYWYAPLATPITIAAGQYYSLSASVAIATGTRMGYWTPISGIQITQAIMGFTAGSINTNYASSIGGTAKPINVNAWLEPLATPEPATYLMLGSLVAVSSIAIYKRRKLA